MSLFGGIVESWVAADLMGTIVLEDDRRVIFTPNAWQGFGAQLPQRGLRVSVSDVQPWREHLRTYSVSPAPATECSWSEVRDSLRWRLVSLEEVAAEWTVEPGPVAATFFAVGYDLGQSDSLSLWRPVTAADLHQWGVPPESVIARADRLLEEHEVWFRGRGGVNVVTAADAYAAAQLRDPEVLFARLDLSGLPVVFPVHAHQYFVVGTDDAESLRRIASVVEDTLLNGPHAGVTYRVAGTDRLKQPDRAGLSGDAAVWTHGRWQPLQVGDHPAAEALGRLSSLGRAAMYNRQKVALQAEIDMTGDDVFVASVMRSDFGRLYTVWGLGVQTLLPRAPAIALVADQMESGGEVPIISWDSFISIMNLPRTPHDPSRWEATAFPTARQITSMEPASGFPSFVAD